MNATARTVSPDEWHEAFWRQGGGISPILEEETDEANKTEKGWIRKRLPRPSAGRLALLLSTAALIGGIVLFGTSRAALNNKNQSSSDPAAPATPPKPLLNQTLRRGYARLIQSTVLSAATAPLGNSSHKELLFLEARSPHYAALQWMVLRDPLAAELALAGSDDDEQGSSVNPASAANSNIFRSSSPTAATTTKTKTTRILQRMALAVLYYAVAADQAWPGLQPKHGWLKVR
jgi:hypothetical protein